MILEENLMNTKPRLARRLTSAIGALALASASLFAAGIPATAAPAPTILGPGIVLPMADIGTQLTGVSATITGTSTPTLTWSELYQLTYTAGVPDSANAGDSWTIDLPTQLTGWPDGPEVINPNNPSDVWATMTIVGGKATFTLTESGAAQSNLVVNANFGGALSNNTSLGAQALEVKQNGTVIGKLDINVKPRPVVPPVTNWKSLWFRGDSNQCRKTTNECLAGELGIMAGDHGKVTITDKAQPNWEFQCSSIWLELVDYSGSAEVTTRANDRLQLTCNSRELTAVIDTSGANAKQGYKLKIYMNAMAASGSGGVQYSNTANSVVDGRNWTLSTAVQSTYVGASGSGATFI